MFVTGTGNKVASAMNQGLLLKPLNVACVRQMTGVRRFIHVTRMYTIALEVDNNILTATFSTHQIFVVKY
jgi:hypothetical protein